MAPLVRRRAVHRLRAADAVDRQDDVGVEQQALAEAGRAVPRVGDPGSVVGKRAPADDGLVVRLLAVLRALDAGVRRHRRLAAVVEPDAADLRPPGQGRRDRRDRARGIGFPRPGRIGVVVLPHQRSAPARRRAEHELELGHRPGRAELRGGERRRRDREEFEVDGSFGCGPYRRRGQHRGEAEDGEGGGEARGDRGGDLVVRRHMGEPELETGGKNSIAGPVPPAGRRRTDGGAGWTSGGDDGQRHGGRCVTVSPGPAPGVARAGPFRRRRSQRIAAPAACHAPSFARSASVMPVRLPIGIARVATACS